MFFVWYDDDPKKPGGDKLTDAISAYVRRFAKTPSLVLVNPVDELMRDDISVRCTITVRPNTFWLGIKTAADDAAT